MAPLGVSGWHLISLGITSSSRAPWKLHLERENIPIQKQSDYSLYMGGSQQEREADRVRIQGKR